MDIKEEFEPEIGSTELLVQTVRLPTKQSKPTNIAMWSNEETKKLCELYKHFINDVGPFKLFKLKKDMWNEISNQIGTKTSKQCDERLKTLLRRKKKGIIEKVYVSDEERKIMDIEEEDENEFHIYRKQKINLDSDDYFLPFKDIRVWSNSETKMLMELYRSYITEVGPQKKFMHKKDMWAAIASNFHDKNGRQCEQRFNTVLKRKKKGFTKIYISKARRKTIDFRPRHLTEASTLKMNKAQDLDNIIMKDIVNPYKKRKEDKNAQQKPTPKPTNNEPLSISETLLKIAAEKEEGKERRHRERMEAMEKMQNLLQRILNSKK